jgi:hypothetical protein
MKSNGADKAPTKNQHRNLGGPVGFGAANFSSIEDFSFM